MGLAPLLLGYYCFRSVPFESLAMKYSGRYLGISMAYLSGYALLPWLALYPVNVTCGSGLVGLALFLLGYYCFRRVTSESLAIKYLGRYLGISTLGMPYYLGLPFLGKRYLWPWVRLDFRLYLYH